MSRLAASLLLVLVLTVPTPLQAAAQGRAYGLPSVWHWFIPSGAPGQGGGTDLLDDAALACDLTFVGVDGGSYPNPFALDPDDARHAACIVGAMRSNGASPDAVRFFERSHRFLYDVRAVGPAVDVGHVNAPWINMGRAELAFLGRRGDPITLFCAVAAAGADDWASLPGYGDLAASGSPWCEYTQFRGSEALPDGGQRVFLDEPIKPCRACAPDGWMPLSLTFDAAGLLVGSEIAPPKPVEAS